MHRDTLIKHIRTKIRDDFGTSRAAAPHFGISRCWLSNVLNKDIPIPPQILEWAGAEPVTSYQWVRKNGK